MDIRPQASDFLFTCGKEKRLYFSGNIKYITTLRETIIIQFRLFGNSKSAVVSLFLQVFLSNSDSIFFFAKKKSYIVFYNSTPRIIRCSLIRPASSIRGLIEREEAREAAAPAA